MARNLTSGWQTEAAAATRRPVVLFEADFVSGVLRLWNGLGDLTWNGQTWSGNGWFQAPDGMEETIEIEATDMSVILSGVPASVLSLVLGQQKQGGAGRFYLGFLDAAGAVVADPYLAWSGFYSHAEVSESPTESTATLYYDSPLVDLDRPKEGRWTQDCQNRLFPGSGDRGFEYVVAAANWSGTWGQGRKKPDRKDPPKGSRGRR